eukprot:97837-Ditylum_brightwellii.AAC.1
MEEVSDDGMTYPHMTHISHEVAFQFLEPTLSPMQQALDVVEVVNSGIKNILKQYVGYLPFHHDLVLMERGIESANKTHRELCFLFHWLSVLMVEGDRSNSCTAEHLNTISKETARNLVNTEFSSYLHIDEKNIGQGSKLLRVKTAINVGIKINDGTLNNRDLLQTGAVVSCKMNEDKAQAIIGTNVGDPT